MAWWWYAQPSKKSKPYVVLTKEEMERLIQSFPPRKLRGCRNRAIASTLWRCQLRVSELIHIQEEDINFERGSITIWGKGDKFRHVAIPPKAVDPLILWLERRRRIPKILDAGTSWVFDNLQGWHLNRNSVLSLLTLQAERIGLGKRCNPHQLRHTGASHLVDCNINPLHIQLQLGHSSLLTTINYLHNVNPQGMLEQISERGLF